MFSCAALKNLYVDREITGEVFLKPYKWGNLTIHILCTCSGSGYNCLSKTIRGIARAALYIFFGPLVVIGMIIKCLNAQQVKNYNEQLKQKIANRETTNKYPNQPENVYRLPAEAIFSELDENSKDWKRCPANIFGYSDGKVLIQFIKRYPRWEIPTDAARLRPFAF